tara:strand:- start:529 stop:828 length:300 start_codon:yes stop_codon:yes gene_type:complete
MDFKTIEQLRDDVDKLAEQWKPLMRGKHKVVVSEQRKLNETFRQELERLREEFLHFKLHTLAAIEKTTNTDTTTSGKELRCVTNPFSLYSLSSKNSTTS